MEEVVDVGTDGPDGIHCLLPSGCFGCSATLVGSHVLVFGGNAADGTFCEDLAVWSVERGCFEEPTSFPSLEKSGRGHHAACERDGALWVFGGKANGYTNDLHRLDSDYDCWRSVVAEGEVVPEPRYGMASCVAGGEWLIHGGYNSNASVCGDLWSFSFATRAWTRRQTSGAVPTARMHHAMVTVGQGKVFMWGGKDAKGASSPIVHLLDVASGAWSKLKDGKKRQKGAKKGEGTPRARWGHSAGAVLQRQGPAVVVFGGRDEAQVFSDAWLLSVDEGRWQLLETGLVPEPRAFHAAAIVGEQLLLFGGMNLDKDAFDTVCRLDVSRECCIAKLPSDVLIYILSLVDPSDLLRAAQVSRAFNKAASSERLWKPIAGDLWRWFPPQVAWLKHGVRMKNADKLSAKQWCRVVVLARLSDFERSSIDVVPVKLVLIGDGGVGKTCMLIRYTERVFPHEYVPTVFDNFATTTEHLGFTVSLSFFDTAGPEDYSRLRLLSYPMTNVFLVCFSLVSSFSFDEVRTKWVPEVRGCMRELCPRAKLLLVGTKKDLLSDAATLQRLAERGESVVTTQQAEAMAGELGCDGYIETSALSGEGVDEAIALALELACRSPPDDEGVHSRPIGLHRKDKCVLQ